MSLKCPWLELRLSGVITEAITPLLTLNSDAELILIFGSLTSQLCHPFIQPQELILIIISDEMLGNLGASTRQ